MVICFTNLRSLRKEKILVDILNVRSRLVTRIIETSSNDTDLRNATSRRFRIKILCKGSDNRIKEIGHPGFLMYELTLADAGKKK